ncbi:ricin B lectin domain-containing protein [Armillaria novae-zelandiae]|uniref:Ricin B lectin domain-containing protein n=1 Tax=Armillaria novae-zelandiae TaxID=153914 RepID=A0AA39NMX7_9AGAR|nr:ricin B lectin domain-containing protein [Armillaria novae-zelandiae]
MSVDSGSTYKIRNAKSGTILDLSGVDNTAIIGYPDHNGANQQWVLTWTGRSWTFRSVSSNQYLGLEGSAGNGTKLLAVAQPFEWHIWHDETDQTTFRVFAPNTTYNFDLWNYGDPVPGDPITLWTKWDGLHQTWRFERGELAVLLLKQCRSLNVCNEQLINRFHKEELKADRYPVLMQSGLEPPADSM